MRPMGDRVTQEQRSENMRRIRSADTKPELVVRRLSYALGFRHRLHGKKLPGKPDLVYPGRKKVIFVHGCYWHQHTDPNCKISHRPKSNLSYWSPKLERNVSRDAKNQAKLREMGWDYLIIWECQVKDTQKVSDRMTAFLN
jgi:DNA mismatch endonuclease, patch repair protein